MALFKDMVAYQEEVRDPSRIAEVLNRVISVIRLSAPAKLMSLAISGHRLLILTRPRGGFERPSGGEEAIAQAAKCCRKQSFRYSERGRCWRGN